MPILYRPSEDGVDILRLAHGPRKLQGALAPAGGNRVIGDQTNRQGLADSAELMFHAARAPALCDGHNTSTCEFDTAAIICPVFYPSGYTPESRSLIGSGRQPIACTATR
jgi:hypothetical protein